MEKVLIDPCFISIKIISFQFIVAQCISVYLVLSRAQVLSMLGPTCFFFFSSLFILYIQTEKNVVSSIKSIKTVWNSDFELKSHMQFSFLKLSNCTVHLYTFFCITFSYYLLSSCLNTPSKLMISTVIKRHHLLPLPSYLWFLWESVNDLLHNLSQQPLH